MITKGKGLALEIIDRSLLFFLCQGLSHSRYQHLLHAWQDFLSEDRKSVNGSRPGPDHDSWPAFQKKLESFQHYKIDSECNQPSLPPPHMLRLSFSHRWPTLLYSRRHQASLHLGKGNQWSLLCHHCSTGNSSSFTPWLAIQRP